MNEKCIRKPYIANRNKPCIWQQHFKKYNPSIGPTSKAQIMAVRRILFWPPDSPLPRCHAKVRSFVKKREAQGDYSHSARNHICDVCRCTKTAGSKTKGNFYGLGPETGHLGVGYCLRCENSRQHRSYSFAKNQLRDLQIYGKASMDSERYLAVTKEEAEIAEVSLRAKEDIALMAETLHEFKRSLDQEKADELATLPILREILDRLQNVECIDKETGEYLRDQLFDAILVREQLTEMTKVGPVPMTDKTKIDIKLKMADIISKCSMRHFKMDSSDYVHYDELAARMHKMISLCKRLVFKAFELGKNEKAGKEIEPIGVIQEDVVKGLKDIWKNTKTGMRE